MDNSFSVYQKASVIQCQTRTIKVKYLAEPNIGIQTMLEQECQQISDKLKSGSLVLIPGQRDVLRGRKVQYVQRGQVTPRSTIRTGAVLAQDPDAVEVADLHSVREMMENVSM